MVPFHSSFYRSLKAASMRLLWSHVDRDSFNNATASGASKPGVPILVRLKEETFHFSDTFKHKSQRQKLDKDVLLRMESVLCISVST